MFRFLLVLTFLSSFPLQAYAQTTACIDSDNDGWGWNGVASCRVAPAVVATADRECFDSDPVGDGWGWNGVESCRIGVPTGNSSDDATSESSVGSSSEASSAGQADELALIRSKFGASESVYFPGWNRTGVGIYCPAELNRAEEVFYLFFDGELKLLSGWGQWSGGWQSDDNRLKFFWRRHNDSALLTSSVIISEAGVEMGGGSRQCSWL